MVSDSALMLPGLTRGDQRYTGGMEIPGGRRALYAEATRAAIVDAARSLFRARGYAATRVDDIAGVAGVAPKTVYAVAGGKTGLLSTLIDEWVRDPSIEVGLSDVPAFVDSRAMLRQLAEGSGSVYRTHYAVVRAAVEAAIVDPTAAARLAEATSRIRGEMLRIVQNIRARGELRPGISDEHGVDVLFYYFGFRTFPTLTQELGWSHEKAETWLAKQAVAALLNTDR